MKYREGFIFSCLTYILHVYGSVLLQLPSDRQLLWYSIMLFMLNHFLLENMAVRLLELIRSRTMLLVVSTSQYMVPCIHLVLTMFKLNKLLFAYGFNFRTYGTTCISVCSDNKLFYVTFFQKIIFVPFCPICDLAYLNCGRSLETRNIAVQPCMRESLSKTGKLGLLLLEDLTALAAGGSVCAEWKLMFFSLNIIIEYVNILKLDECAGFFLPGNLVAGAFTATNICFGYPWVMILTAILWINSVLIILKVVLSEHYL